LPNGATGAQYLAALQTDSNIPVTWSIENGNLPTGLFLDETTGVIDGFPTETGTFDFTIQATHIGGSASKEFSITVTLGAGIGELLDELRVFPNPTTGELTITNYELRIMDIEVFDVYGRKLSSHHLITSSSHHKIDISDLSAGVYFVKIRTEAGEVMKKIVKK
jgi:hypothetical protein